MAQGKLALLTTALCFGVICLHLATSVSSVKPSTLKKQSSVDDDDVYEQLYSDRQRSKHHRSKGEESMQGRRKQKPYRMKLRTEEEKEKEKEKEKEPEQEQVVSEIPSFYPEVKDLGCGRQVIPSPNSTIIRSRTAGCYQFPAGPVCGSNKRIYESLCALEQSNCKRKVKVTPVDPKLCLTANARIIAPQIYDKNNTLPLEVTMGFCRKIKLKCPPYATCGLYRIVESEFIIKADVFDIYECICESYCEQSYAGKSNREDLVCGTDHVTYSSMCELRRTACYENRHISRSKSTSNCLEPTIFFNPNYVGIPPASYGTPKPPKSKPANKKNSVSPSIGLEVPRSACAEEQLYCSIHAKCVREQNSQVHFCFCNPKCKSPPGHICGTDGKTYEDKCSLTWTSCVDNLNTTVAHTGECVSRQVTRLPTTAAPSPPVTTKKPEPIKIKSNEQVGVSSSTKKPDHPPKSASTTIPTQPKNVSGTPITNSKPPNNVPKRLSTTNRPSKLTKATDSNIDISMSQHAPQQDDDGESQRTHFVVETS